jgi:hypothetical protein
MSPELLDSNLAQYLYEASSIRLHLARASAVTRVYAATRHVAPYIHPRI